MNWIKKKAIFKIIFGIPFHILWGDNFYEIIGQYFKYHIVQFQAQQALQKAVMGVSYWAWHEVTKLQGLAN